MSNREHWTLILVSDETAPMRRVQLRRAWLLRAAVAVGLLVLGGAALLADYARLRIERPEVAARPARAPR